MSAASDLPRSASRPIGAPRAATALSRALAVTFACGALGIAGCTAVGPDYRRPATALPAAYPGEPAAGEAIVQPRWWTLYSDATLTALVDAALARNADVRLAAARVEETEAVLAQARAAMFPEVDLQGSSTRARSSQVGAVPLPTTTPIVQSTQRLVLSTTFELDFWGRLRRADEAARAQALGTRYGQGVVATTLAGSTVQSYFALRSIEAQAASLAATVIAREGSLDLARRRAAGGIASDLDVAQANGALADARVQLRELQRQRAIIEHQLAVLTGQPGATVPAGAGIAALPLVPVPPAGLPSSLVDRRPDVRQAEQVLASASALIGVAKAQEYPTFSLTAFLGGQAADLGNVISGAGRVGSLGASVFWPVFDAGRYRARTREAEARAEQAAAAYERTVQTAWREVADALDNVGAAAQSEADVEARLRAAREALRISQIRYDAGYSGYLEVLDAQRTLNGAELASIQNRQARLAASVDLMKALGGGWQLPAAIGAADGARPGGVAVAR